MHLQLHRVAQGCILIKRYLRTRYQTHIKDMLAQRTLVAYALYSYCLSYFQF